MQEILREWKTAHSAITESLLQDETITGARIEELMNENPPSPELADLSDWNVSLLSWLSFHSSSLALRYRSIHANGLLPYVLTIVDLLKICLQEPLEIRAFQKRSAKQAYVRQNIPAESLA